MTEDSITIVTNQDHNDKILMRACECIVKQLETQAPLNEQQIMWELREQCVGITPQDVAQIYFKAMSILSEIGKIELYEPDLALMSWRLKEEPASEPEPPQLRVWWFSSSIRKTFRFPVKTIEEGFLVLKALIEYDLYLGELVASNGGGLEERKDTSPFFNREDWEASFFEPDGTVWQEWMDENGNCALTIVDKKRP